MARDNYKLYRIMHRFGKLISCDADNPATADKMFLEEFLEEIKDESKR